MDPRENPNSTNPYFQNKARTPDISNMKQAPPTRVGFGAQREINRSPEVEEETKTTPKQKPRQAQRRNIHEKKPEEYDLGGNFIR